nr:uncharacterized serine-rich protein C215.13-like isoform X2 [Hydra vulgaris]
MLTIKLCAHLYICMFSTTSILLLAQINVSVASITQVNGSSLLEKLREEISSTSQVNVFSLSSSQTVEIIRCTTLIRSFCNSFIPNENSSKTYSSILFFPSTTQVNDSPLFETQLEKITTNQITLYKSQPVAIDISYITPSITSIGILKNEESSKSQDLSPRIYSHSSSFNTQNKISDLHILNKTISSTHALNKISGLSQINVFTTFLTKTLETNGCFSLFSIFCTPIFSTPLYTSSSLLQSERNYKSQGLSPRLNSLTVFSKSITHVDDSTSFSIIDNIISSTSQIYISEVFSSQKNEIIESSEILTSSFFYSKIYSSTSTTSSSLAPNESYCKIQVSSPRVYSSTVFSVPITQGRDSSLFNSLSKHISSNSPVYVLTVSSSQKIEIIESSEILTSSFFYSQTHSTPSINSSSFALNKSYYKAQTLSLRVYSTIKYSESSSIKNFIVDINKMKEDKKSPRLASWIIVLIVVSVFLITMVIVILLKKNLKKVQNRVQLFRFSRRIYPNVSNVKDAEAPQSTSLTVNSQKNTKYNVDSCRLNDILSTKYKSRTEADEKSDL